MHVKRIGISLGYLFHYCSFETMRSILFLTLFTAHLLYVAQSFSINASSCDVKVAQSKSFSHQSAKDSGIQIRTASGNKGLGAFATTHIPVGSLLGEYRGEKMTKEEVHARFWGKRKQDRNDIAWAQSRSRRGQGITGDYLLEASDDIYVDCEDEDVSTWCRFLNHDDEASDGCNVKAFMRTVEGGELHQWPQMYAIDNIEKGEELCWGKFQEKENHSHKSIFHEMLI